MSSQKTRVSLTMPVHNEENYLRYVLPSIRAIRHRLHEIIITCDHCTDHSQELIEEWLPEAKVFCLGEHEWNFYAAETFQYGFDNATGDVILATGADLILEPSVFDAIEQDFKDERVGTVCFRYYNYDLSSFMLRLHGTYENLYRSLIQHIRTAARHSGFYAFRKKMMEEIGGLADIISEYDEFCIRTQKHGWKMLYEPHTHVLHLRAGLTPRKAYLQGVARFSLPQYSLLKTLFHSFVHLKPHLVVGYLHAKHYGVKEAGTLR